MQTVHRLVSPQIKALRVLVVEDEHSMRKVTRAILAAMGIQNVLEAADGTTGLEIARTKHPDLIIVDWEMPLMNGPQFVQTIRTPGNFPVPDIPIIILSAHSDHWRVVESARIGANEFVRKPVSIKTLSDRIVAVLSRPRPTVKLESYCGPAPREVGPIFVL
jgi:DNA-binding response OmpR family regulator